MKQIKDARNVSVVFIPDFIVTTLKSRGMELIDLETSFVTNRDNTLTWLKNNLSKLDIKDWLGTNHMMCSKLLPRQKNLIYNTQDNSDIQNMHTNLEVYLRDSIGMFEDVENLEQLLSLYSSSNIDIKSIILSNNHKELPYTLVRGNDTVFVIISEGFMNFIVYDIKLFKEIFISSLIDYCFNGLGELRTTRSPLFIDYISLLLTNRNN